MVIKSLTNILYQRWPLSTTGVAETIIQFLVIFEKFDGPFSYRRKVLVYNLLLHEPKWCF